MTNFQVWLRGSDLVDVHCETEQEARAFVRDYYGYKRLPNGTCVCEIPPGYYQEIIESNRRQGFDASNM
jgi:hypothetical protein